MNAVTRSLLAAGLFLSAAQAAFAQTADEIIEKHLTALGGRAALGKLTSRTMVGTVTISSPVGDVSGPIEIVAQVPNKSRTLIKLDLSSFGAGPVTVDERFDGTAGYVIDTLQGNRDIVGGQLEAMKNGSFPSPYLSYRDVGTTVELGGKEKVGEHDTFLLILKPRSGPVARQYIDTLSYLPIKQVVKLDLAQVGELEQTTELFDYREVDGVKVPFRIKTSNAMQNVSIVITKVEHNTPTDAALFSKP
jgi:hypothetical protein